MLNAEECHSSFVSFNSSAVSRIITADGELNFSVSTRTRESVFRRASSPVSGMVLCQEIEGGHAGGGRERLLLFQQTEIWGLATKIS